jgi:hypothetical protein
MRFSRESRAFQTSPIPPRAQRSEDLIGPEFLADRKRHGMPLILPNGRRPPNSTQDRYDGSAMPPGSSIDDIVELYKRDVDVTLLDECLRRTIEQRLQALQSFSKSIDELREQTRKTNDSSK